MKSVIIIFSYIFLSFFPFYSCIDNPIIWADVPDVDFIRVDDTFYMISTTMFFSPGAPIMKSTDLVKWELCSYVYDIYADTDFQNLENGKSDYAAGQYASSIRYNEGTFYVFFCSYSSGKSYIFRTENIEISGGWIKSEINGDYHDASMLFDDDGKKYLIYGGGGEIKIKELNNDLINFHVGGVDQTLFKTNLTGLAGQGSHALKIKDYYYIFIMVWPSGKERTVYCYRSKEILGEYEGKIILESGLGNYKNGVAHGAIVDTLDGKWWGLFFQDHGSVGRCPCLLPVTWQNDWPMLGIDGKVPVSIDIEINSTATSMACSDDFNYTSNSELKMEWQWNHNPDNEAWSVIDREGYLRLYNKHNASSLIHAKNTLTMRTEGPACSSYIILDTSNLKIGDHAGLAAFQYNFGCVGVYVDDEGEKKIYMAKNGNMTENILDSSEKIIEEVDLNKDEVYLKINFKFSEIDENKNTGNIIDRASFFYSFNGISWTRIGEELDMTYDLKMFTGYRSAIYSYSTIFNDGYADIERFVYKHTIKWNGI